MLTDCSPYEQDKGCPDKHEFDRDSDIVGQSTHEYRDNSSGDSTHVECLAPAEPVVGVEQKPIQPLHDYLLREDVRSLGTIPEII